jgi:hypothetical protein
MQEEFRDAQAMLDLAATDQCEETPSRNQGQDSAGRQIPMLAEMLQSQAFRLSLSGWTFSAYPRKTARDPIFHLR